MNILIERLSQIEDKNNEMTAKCQQSKEALDKELSKQQQDYKAEQTRKLDENIASLKSNQENKTKQECDKLKKETDAAINQLESNFHQQESALLDGLYNEILEKLKGWSYEQNASL